MVRTEEFISVLCLYSQQDADYKNDFAQRMKLLQQAQRVNLVRYNTVEQFLRLNTTNDDLKKTIDVVILLVSTAFLASEMGDSPRLKFLLDAHRTNIIKLLTVLIKPIESSPLLEKGSVILPISRTPIVQVAPPNREDAWQQLTSELKEAFAQIRSLKQRIETAWRIAQQENTATAYGDFLLEIPYSKHTSEATVLRNHIKEKELWREVSLRTNMHNLLQYLKDAPLQSHQNEAYDKILEIEQDVAIAWADTQQHPNQIGFQLDFRSRFPNDKNAATAALNVQRLLTRPFEQLRNPDDLEDVTTERTDLIPAIQTENDYLDYHIFQVLSPEELLSVQQLTDYANKLVERFESVQGKFSELIQNIRYITLLVVGTALIYLLLQFYYPASEGIAEDILRFGIPLVLVGTLLYFCYFLFQKANSDYKKAVSAVKTIERKEVALRVNYLIHNEKELRTTIKSLISEEAKLQRLRKKTIPSYLFGK